MITTWLALHGGFPLKNIWTSLGMTRNPRGNIEKMLQVQNTQPWQTAQSHPHILTSHVLEKSTDPQAKAVFSFFPCGKHETRLTGWLMFTYSWNATDWMVDVHLLFGVIFRMPDHHHSYHHAIMASWHYVDPYVLFLPLTTTSTSCHGVLWGPQTKLCKQLSSVTASWVERPRWTDVFPSKWRYR